MNLNQNPFENSEHLQWLHDRVIKVYGESENVDFLIKTRKIIEDQKSLEVTFNTSNEMVMTRKIRERKGGKY
tara:strand:- start:610 stop:825 length:216 start_codon:yes stop_codon:yes gene_type:complete